MISKPSILLTAALGVAEAADYWFVPPGLTDAFCDGITRPDWAECESKYVEWFQSREMHIGPGFLEGQTFTGDKCQMRYVQCSDSGHEWTMDSEEGIFDLARNACTPLGDVGGVQRQGDLCVIVEDPKNPLKPKDVKKARGEFVTQATRPADAVTEHQKHSRSHPRDVSANSAIHDLLQARAEGECYTYTEQKFATNIRGIEQKVCDDILPDGASCANSKAVTITDSYTASIDVSTSLEEVISVNAGFSTTYSEAVTTTLTTTITIDCDGGSGYVVWYPLTQVTTGICGKGTFSQSGETCLDLSPATPCSAQKPIVPEEGSLSGEYDVVCV